MHFPATPIHAETQTAPLTLLQHGPLTLGVQADIGGRIVLLKQGDSDNLLDSQPQSWKQAPAEPLTVDTQVPGLNGHTVWVGPQEEWWIRQELLPEKKKGREPWPPDPVLEYGRGTVLERTATSLVIELPASPFTGVQLRKSVQLLSDSQVRLRVTATNRRNEPLTWGLWSNTRVAPRSNAYVPITGRGRVRVEFLSWNPSVESIWPWLTTQDWVHLDSAAPVAPGGRAIHAKILIDSAPGLIACFTANHLLLKQTTPLKAQQVHPHHAPIEIFGRRTGQGQDDLLELEMHGELTTLQPQEAMNFDETWTVLAYRGEASPKAHIEFLRAHLPSIPGHESGR